MNKHDHRLSHVCCSSDHADSEAGWIHRNCTLPFTASSVCMRECIKFQAKSEKIKKYIHPSIHHRSLIRGRACSDCCPHDPAPHKKYSAEKNPQFNNSINNFSK